MSMQQSNTATDLQGISITQTSCLPPPRPAWQVRAHAAGKSMRAARREREREEIREAISLGVKVIAKVRFDRTWHQWEDDLLILHREDLAASRATLPHRGAEAVETRRQRLSLTRNLKLWTTPEERVIRANYLKVSSTAGLAALLPGRTAGSVQKHLKLLGLSIPRPASDSGSDLVDAVLDRIRLLGYTRKDLDGLAGTGTYFGRRGYKARPVKGSFRPVQLCQALTKAVAALGGTLRVDWPDDGESVDTIDVGGG